MRSSCIIELVEIYKYSEFEVSKCVGNSPKVIRKHYMNQMQADHKKEAEAQKAEDEGTKVGTPALYRSLPQHLVLIR